MLQTFKNLTLFIQWIFVTVIQKTIHIVIFVMQRETLLSTITWKYLRENYKTLKVLPLVRSTEEVKYMCKTPKSNGHAKNRRSASLSYHLFICSCNTRLKKVNWNKYISYDDWHIFMIELNYSEYNLNTFS